METAITKPLRAGPRPLPTHLLTASMAYTSSNAGLPLLRSGSLNSTLAAERVESVNNAANRVDATALAQAVEQKAAPVSTISCAASCLSCASLSPRCGGSRDHLVEGSTRLLKYPATSGVPKADLVTVLINRAYVLDLSSRSSFMVVGGADLTAISSTGADPVLRADFRSHRLLPVVSGAPFRRSKTGQNYRHCLLVIECGDLALAHALRHRARVGSRPWPRPGISTRPTPLGQGNQRADLRTAWTFWANCRRTFSNAILHARSAARLVSSKPSRDGSIVRPRLDFVALEDWLNDGVPLTARVAQECLGDWYGNNTPAGGSWQIDGQPVSPSALSIPSIAVIPAHDRIVPPESAMSLARSLPDCHTISPQAGHIGMMAGRNAEATVWRPLETWLAAQCAK